jgi:hypothetical protein
MDVLVSMRVALRSGSNARYFVGGRVNALRAMLFGAIRVVRHAGTSFTSISAPAAMLPELSVRFQHIRTLTSAALAPSRSDRHFAHATRAVRL